jgi:hypothetical protein
MGEITTGGEGGPPGHMDECLQHSQHERFVTEMSVTYDLTAHYRAVPGGGQEKQGERITFLA